MIASSESISTHCEFLGTNNLSHALCRSDYHCAKGEGPGMISLSYLIVNSSAVGNNLAGSKRSMAHYYLKNAVI